MTDEGRVHDAGARGHVYVARAHAWGGGGGLEGPPEGRWYRGTRTLTHTLSQHAAP